MILTLNGINYTVNNPKYGYSVTVESAIIRQQKTPRGYACWDNGLANDNRISQFEFSLSATDADTLLGAIEDDNKGRGLPISVNLGSSSGFYIGGPDKGDAGIFTAKLMSHSATGPRLEPYLRDQVKLQCMITAFPSYTLGTPFDEGPLSIGSISNVIFPQEFTSQNVDYGYSVQRTLNDVYTVDKTTLSDNYRISISLKCNQTKAAQIISHLFSTVRASDVVLYCPPGGYLFGSRRFSGGVYTCKWIDQSVTITHVGHDEFDFTLNFYLINYSAAVNSIGYILDNSYALVLDDSEGIVI